jgi:hypothetical protein
VTGLLHCDALVKVGSFWRTLASPKVTLGKLINAVHQIEQTAQAADRAYNQALTKHPSSLDLTGAYIKFLRHVQHDVWGAARWTIELEKLQLREEESSYHILLAKEELNVSSAALMQKAVVVMGANCVMRMANEVRLLM